MIGEIRAATFTVLEFSKVIILPTYGSGRGDQTRAL
jgi:hypothetical protein